MSTRGARGGSDLILLAVGPIETQVPPRPDPSLHTAPVGQSAPSAAKDQAFIIPYVRKAGRDALAR
jgi:hypothetical protein